jgi:hypothetical protein
MRSSWQGSGRRNGQFNGARSKIGALQLLELQGWSATHRPAVRTTSVPSLAVWTPFPLMAGPRPTAWVGRRTNNLRSGSSVGRGCGFVEY